LKIPLIVLLFLIVCVSSAIQAETLSRERQVEIIENYMYVTGQSTQLPPQALEVMPYHPEQPPLKCGTPAIADFEFYRDKLDPDLLKALGVRTQTRPSYPDERTFDSPDSLFKVHYTTSGYHAVYCAGDDGDGDGVPDYVENVAVIMDSVYDHEINLLGYPPPPSDGFYDPSGDKYDVYISNLGGAVFGQTYPDEYALDDTNHTRVTSFLEVENDYKEMLAYKDRPLDAVRVTCSHEFFHAVQFGIDYTEMEVDTLEETYYAKRYWMEMSAVWMEEEIYDGINDYYAYLPFFFDYPRQSIQQFNTTTNDLHPYGSVVLPIFLSEKYGRDIIKDIWLRCGAMGPGPQFLAAADSVIDSLSAGTDDWPTAFREFALWNYFTGERSSYVPEGVGYSEKEMYPAIPDTIFQQLSDTCIDTIPGIVNHTEYPVKELGNENTWKPEHNGAAYVQFHYTHVIKSDTTFWVCHSWVSDSCTDSTQVIDTTLGYDFMRVDSFFTVFIALGDGVHLSPPQPWGLSILYMADTLTDSVAVDKLLLEYGSMYKLQIPNPNQYWSVAMIISPGSDLWQAYRSTDYDFSLSYYVPEVIESILPQGLAAVLAPYPNPAVVSEMGGSPLKFKFQIPMDSLDDYLYPNPRLSVDIFNVAGEFVKGFDTTLPPYPWNQTMEFVLDWNMKNERGRDVASGVYIAVARLYSEVKKGLLLAADKAKIAIIR